MVMATTCNIHFTLLIAIAIIHITVCRNQMSLFTVLMITQCLVTSSTALFRIVGGKTIGIDEVPYQLSLRREDSHICGAALISPNYALSAAHCFEISAKYTVKGGSGYKDEGGTVTEVKTVILHPERANHKNEYDIAILELLEIFPLNRKTIWPINLPENNDLLVPGVKGLISGFGDTVDSAHTGSRFLRAAEVYVENKDWCQMNYNDIQLSPMVFCAGIPGITDSCQGDSGGPLAIDNVLYGLVSFGKQCGDPKHPGVYTSVPAFREFIRLNTGL